jgi:hypothetical protein
MMTVRLKGGPANGAHVRLPATRVHYYSGRGVPEGHVAIYKPRHQRPRTLRFDGFRMVPTADLAHNQ